MPRYVVLEDGRFGEGWGRGDVVEMDPIAAEVPLERGYIRPIGPDPATGFEAPSRFSTEEFSLESLDLTLGVLRKLKLKPWLAFGTALGFYRDHTFCRGDEDDVDIGINVSAWKKEKEIVAGMEEAGFFLKHRWNPDGFAPELAFERYDKGKTSKVDLFFFSREGEKACWRFYEGLSGFKFKTKEISAHHFTRLSSVERFGKKYPIPGDIEGYLEANYGDWRTPLPREAWNWLESNRCPDAKLFLADMSQVTAIVKTFMRDEYFYNCVRTLRETYPDIKIAVADDGKPSAERERFIRDHADIALTLPFDSGLCVGRNRLIEKVKTPFVLIGDDDFHYTQETNVEHLVAMMDVADVACGAVNDKGVGIVHYEGTMDLREGRLLYHKMDPHGFRCHRGITYKPLDIGFNFMVTKTDVALACKWDEQIKVAYEHSDFFLSAQKAGKRVVYVPSACVLHKPPHIPSASKEYQVFRNRKSDKERFYDKWGIDYLIDMNGFCAGRDDEKVAGHGPKQ